MATILDEKFKSAINNLASPLDKNGRLKTRKWYEYDCCGVENFDTESAILDFMICANLSGAVATLGIAYLDERDDRKRQELKQKYAFAKQIFYETCIESEDEEGILKV